MIPAFIILFSVAGTPAGPAVYGGSNESHCRSKAIQLIADIKRGMDLTGSPYSPIEFRCQMVGGGKT